MSQKFSEELPKKTFIALFGPFCRILGEVFENVAFSAILDTPAPQTPIQTFYLLVNGPSMVPLYSKRKPKPSLGNPAYYLRCAKGAIPTESP